EGIADLAISFIFNMVLSSVDISLIFYDGKDMVKKRKHKTFLIKIGNYPRKSVAFFDSIPRKSVIIKHLYR
ncbi:hypothetical protein, partial [Prevotella sp.]|uniref:hypothetical protein n=1 Tax=Prevotella sp. TaxID=59823 RepID=UPI003077E8FE